MTGPNPQEERDGGPETAGTGVLKQLLASVSARVLTAALGLLAIPIYLSLLGLEAFGVVGLFTTLQSLVTLLDFGLSPTLTRELAGQGGKSDSRSRDLVRTFESAYAASGAVIVVGLAALAPWVAAHWVQLDTLSIDEVSRALQIAAVALAIQWPSNLYGAGLLGMNRQAALAVGTAGFAVMRLLMTVLALKWQPTLDSFFAAQAVSSLFQTAGIRWQLWHALKANAPAPRARLQLLRGSWWFMKGMTGIAVLSILLTQMDKVILSNRLRMADYGGYVVATTLSTALYVLIGPLFSVIYPRFATAWGRDRSTLRGLYREASQWMAVLLIPAAVVMAVFPVEAVYVLTGDMSTSLYARWVVVLLVSGTVLNGLLNVPYALQLAAGWTSLSLLLNAMAVGVLAPATWLLAGQLGAVGGALAWLLLNVGLVLTMPPLMHRVLLQGESVSWYVRSLLTPAAVALCVGLVLLALHSPASARAGLAAQLLAYWVLVSLAVALVPPHTRRCVLAAWHSGLR